MAAATPCYDRAAMSILDLLGLKRSSQTPPSGDTETVRRIVRELEALEPERARYLAAFAYILSRVAHADLEISEAETAKMERILQDLGGMPEHQAVLAVQIAKAQSRLAGGTENFLVTREFREIATREQCLELLDCLFAVSAADDSISGAEESQIRQIASELGFSLNEYVAVRSAYSGKREILRGLRREEPELQ
jgi:uncharacterized tellurite resistance protein B-like protein